MKIGIELNKTFSEIEITIVFKKRLDSSAFSINIVFIIGFSLFKEGFGRSRVNQFGDSAISCSQDQTIQKELRAFVDDELLIYFSFFLFGFNLNSRLWKSVIL